MVMARLQKLGGADALARVHRQITAFLTCAPDSGLTWACNLPVTLLLLLPLRGLLGFWFGVAGALRHDFWLQVQGLESDSLGLPP